MNRCPMCGATVRSLTREAGGRWSLGCGDWITDEQAAPISGLVRGFLCPSCNVTEGRSDHNLASWRSGTTPAALMGIEEVYINPVTGTPPPRYAATSDADLDVIADAVTR